MYRLQSTAVIPGEEERVVVSTNIREIFGKPYWVLFYVEIATSAFTVDNLSRHYAKQAY